MKIAIMGAMFEEIEPLLSQVENVKKVKYASNVFYEAEYKGKSLVIAYSKIGKVFAALTATILIERFKCDVLLFSGVAGAVDGELNVGDLLMADGLCQHDVDITAFGHDYGFVPESEVCIPTDLNLRNIAKDLAKKKGLLLKEGLIATGDQFVANSDRKEWISKTFDAKAIEMEGASVAVVCHAMDVPVFILRAISDSADMDANFDFNKFLESSVKVSVDFILGMVGRVG